MNGVFLVLVLGASTDPEGVVEQARQAFEAGELGTEDYLPFDARRGWHQYNDCNVLQMLSDTESSTVERALAPRVRAADADWSRQCAVLRALVVDDAAPDGYELHRYARYWHGYHVPTAVGLRIANLRTLRLALSLGVWSAIFLLALAACMRGGWHMRMTGLVIAGAASTVWAVPHFAPSLTHGPGDAFLLLGLAVIAAWPSVALRPRHLVPFAAAFGAGVVFFEMLTGQLPIAAAWLGAIVLAAVQDETQDTEVPRVGDGGRAEPGRLLRVPAAIAAFGLAAVSTVAVKQVLALLLVDPGSAGPFFANLRLYMSVPAGEGGWPGLLLPFGRLVRQASMLTYGSSLGGYVLVAGSAVAWLVAAVMAIRARDSAEGRAVLLLLGLCMIPVAWVLLLPLHSYVHAPFMARMLVVPISLSVLALLWSLAKRPHAR
jgi:hypothetical protein